MSDNRDILFIRTDGNDEIGIGHVMRCLSIAHAWVSATGKGCIFITADEAAHPLVAQHGFPALCLHSCWNHLDGEIAAMEQLIAEQSVGRLLIDSYFVTPQYLSRMQRATRVAYLDDRNAFSYPCDLLINYNLFGERYDYSWRRGDPMLLGPLYAPLREEFQSPPLRGASPSLQTVLLTTGGSDPMNTAGGILSGLLTHPELGALHYHVVSGRMNPHIDALRQLERETPNVTVHQDVRRMSELFLKCDAAISAGGSTLYELSAMGIPSIIFAWADNQLPGIEAFGDGWMENCGDIRQSARSCVDRILSSLLHYRDAAVREQKSQRLRTLVDGRGAHRIAQALAKI